MTPNKKNHSYDTLHTTGQKLKTKITKGFNILRLFIDSTSSCKICYNFIISGHKVLVIWRMDKCRLLTQAIFKSWPGWVPNIVLAE